MIGIVFHWTAGGSKASHIDKMQQIICRGDA